MIILLFLLIIFCSTHQVLKTTFEHCQYLYKIFLLFVTDLGRIRICESDTFQYLKGKSICPVNNFAILDVGPHGKLS